MDDTLEWKRFEYTFTFDDRQAAVGDDVLPRVPLEPIELPGVLRP
jgi:hypothetical protein